MIRLRVQCSVDAVSEWLALCRAAQFGEPSALFLAAVLAMMYLFDSLSLFVKLMCARDGHAEAKGAM